MSFLSIVKFLVLILSWYFSGAFYLRLAGFKQKAYLNRALVNLTLNIISGLAIFLLLTHFCSYLSHSYNLSLQIFLPLTVLLALYNLVVDRKGAEHIIKRFTIPDILWLLISGHFAYAYFRIDAFMSGSWDRVHHAVIETILANDIYPPAAVASKEHIMDYYHYGIDLIAASISKFCSIPAWDALSFQLALTSFLCLITLYCLINFFIRSQSVSIFLSLFIFGYSSFNHIQFFLEQIPNFHKFKDGELLQAFFLFTHPALKNLSQRLHYYGQSIGFLLAFVMLYVQFHFIWITKETMKKTGIHVLMFISSFMLYFNYPSMWYPIVAAYGAYLGLDFIGSLKNNSIKNALKASISSVISIFAIFLGKFLTFTKSLSHYEGINLFPFQPQAHFNLPTNWFKMYMRYFMNPSEFSQDQFVTEAFNFSKDLKVHIFSEITFREFGLVFIIAFALFIYVWIREKKLHPSFVIFFAGAISCSVPYLFEYILRPHEEIRFFVFGKVVLLIFIIITSFQKVKTLRSLFFSWRIFIPLIMIFCSMANLFTLSIHIPLISKSLLVSPLEKEFVKQMKTVLKSGDVCIDDAKEFANAAPIGSLAGCYGVGYRLLRENTIRKKTAIQTMDPNLLKELDVNYIIITKPKELSQKAFDILHDTSIFTRLFKDSRLPWLIFRFNKDRKYDLPRDYIWTVGIESPKGFKLIKNKQGKIIYSSHKEGLFNVAKDLRKKAAENDFYSEAIWLDIMPIPKDIKDRGEVGVKNQSK